MVLESDKHREQVLLIVHTYKLKSTLHISPCPSPQRLHASSKQHGYKLSSFPLPSSTIQPSRQRPLHFTASVPWAACATPRTPARTPPRSPPPPTSSSSPARARSARGSVATPKEGRARTRAVRDPSAVTRRRRHIEAGTGGRAAVRLPSPCTPLAGRQAGRRQLEREQRLVRTLALSHTAWNSFIFGYSSATPAPRTHTEIGKGGERCGNTPLYPATIQRPSQVPLPSPTQISLSPDLRSTTRTFVGLYLAQVVVRQVRGVLPRPYVQRLLDQRPSRRHRWHGAGRWWASGGQGVRCVSV